MDTPPHARFLLSGLPLPAAGEDAEAGDHAVDVGEVGDAVDQVVDLAVVQTDPGRPERGHVLRGDGRRCLWDEIRLEIVNRIGMDHHPHPLPLSHSRNL